MNDIIKIESLTKKYEKQGGKLALDNISLNIKKGEFIGLLGHNGAGKSTMLNIMSGFIKKTSGLVEIAGFNMDTHDILAKKSMGIVPQDITFDPFFTPYQSIKLSAGLRGVKPSHKEVMDLLEKLHLAEKAHSYTRTLSGGMKRRVLIAKALIHKPKILMLDEPTAGVDINLRNIMWNNIKEINAQGTTIILTTHYLEEAEDMCDRIVIINKGKIVANDSTHSMMHDNKSSKITITLNKSLDIIPDALQRDRNITVKGDTIEVLFNKKDEDIGPIMSIIHNENLKIANIETEKPGLEDVFISLSK